MITFLYHKIRRFFDVFSKTSNKYKINSYAIYINKWRIHSMILIFVVICYMDIFMMTMFTMNMNLSQLYWMI